MMNYRILGVLLLLLVGVQALLISNNSPSRINFTDNGLSNSNGSSPCELYIIKSGDTCFGISLSTNISYTQVMAWNPEINLVCMYVCLLTMGKQE